MLSPAQTCDGKKQKTVLALPCFFVIAGHVEVFGTHPPVSFLCGKRSGGGRRASCKGV